MVDTGHTRARVPQGCDAQGRIPEALPDIEDDEPRNARPLPDYVIELLGIPPVVVTTLACTGLVAAILYTLYWWLA